MQRDENRLPTIGITIGDAAGIGPEIVLKALADPEISTVCRPVIVGDLAHLRTVAEGLSISVDLSGFDDADDSAVETAAVHDLGNLPTKVDHGNETPQTGKAAGEYIEAAVELWRQGRIDAISTAPLNKRSLSLGGYDFVGHTEFLADLTNTKEFRMSFFAGNLRVVLLSTHVSLRKAIDLVQTEALVELIRFADVHLGHLLGRRPKLALAGLNPHASEGGMFGSEEAAQMEPAVSECVERHGINVVGPLSSDTVFIRGFRGEFDGVIACYHDQATIAVKSLSFGSGVNVTLGLPLIRTSVDHGTAFDIAGKGVADESSMKMAIRLAAELAAARGSAAAGRSE